MAIQYPFDLLQGFQGWFTEFNLLYRQEYSRSQGGSTYVKDMGTPLWTATYQTKSLRPNGVDQFKARVKVLDGGLKQFIGRPLSRCYPIAYPNGTGMGDVSAVKLATVSADRKTITLNGLPAGYKVSVGDYIQIGTRNLHQIVDVDGANLGIRPHLWPETIVDDAVTMVRPTCRMVILPGTLQTPTDVSFGRGTITFQAVESR